MANVDKSVSVLSDITVFNKYAKYVEARGRRETWEELCVRNMDMHIRKYPAVEDKIRDIYTRFVIPKKVLPSMRSLQFGGRPIELANNRIFNCAYLPIEAPEAFSETMFLLLGGSGVGYSVQRHHVEKLPVVLGTQDTRKFIIGDSIEGWADAVKVLVEAYFFGKARPVFVYDDIRAKGMPLITSGGKAPGPDPLRRCLENVESVFREAVGRKLHPIEAHDVECMIADAVLAGGIRRAALISLFSRDDLDMLKCKSNDWWVQYPHRGRANNSVVLPRGEVSHGEFFRLWKAVEESGCGEPGFYWTNDEDYGTNPCCEIALRPHQMCNLTEVNVSTITSQEDFHERVKAAAFIGTLQAGYTDFHYLRQVWRDATKEDALLGVGLTGIASGNIEGYDESVAADLAICENVVTAKQIGVNTAARVTTVKPAGTTSLVLGCSSGIHAWHSEYYIRRMRVGKNEALYSYIKEKLPKLVEDDKFNPAGAVLSFPQRAPEGARTREETVVEFLERVSRYNRNWVAAGHVSGANRNNVSCTVSIKGDEWGIVGEWMWRHRGDYNGISVLPYDGGTYVQAPFEECSEETFYGLLEYLEDVDLTEVREASDNTDLKGEVACSGGICELV